jgi:hypothetical protein
LTPFFVIENLGVAKSEKIINRREVLE